MSKVLIDKDLWDVTKWNAQYYFEQHTHLLMENEKMRKKTIPYHELPNDNEPIITYHMRRATIDDKSRITMGHSDCGSIAVWIEKDLPDGNKSELEFGITTEAAKVLVALLINALDEMGER